MSFESTHTIILETKYWNLCFDIRRSFTDKLSIKSNTIFLRLTANFDRILSAGKHVPQIGRNNTFDSKRFTMGVQVPKFDCTKSSQINKKRKF